MFKPTEWPIRTKMYVHRNSDDNAELALQIKEAGLIFDDDGEGALIRFEEIALDVEIGRDGAVKVLAVDGRLLADVLPHVRSADRPENVSINNPAVYE